MVTRYAFVLCLVGIGPIARAAETITVDIHDGLAFGSSRMRAMGGAYTALAEGAGGHLFNAATMVNQPRGVVRSDVRLGLDFAWAQSMIRFAFPGDAPPQPIDNPSLPAYTGFVSGHIHSGVHAAGGTLETQGFRFASTPDSYLLLNHHQIAAGYAHSFFDERLLIGLLADLHIGTVTQYTFAEASPSQRTLFPSAQLGVLVNVTEDTRVGWTLVPAFNAKLNAADSTNDTILSLRQPLTTAFGVCHQREWDVTVDRSYRDRRTAVVAADLVYLGPSRDAFSAAHISQGYTVSSGASPSMSLHLGVETEYVPGWLRLRAGAYTEPARFVLETQRLHLTAGTQIRLFSLPKSLRWAVIGTIDIAPNYLDTSVGVSFW